MASTRVPLQDSTRIEWTGIRSVGAKPTVPAYYCLSWRRYRVGLGGVLAVLVAKSPAILADLHLLTMAWLGYVKETRPAGNVMVTTD
jgi:hypothetical protein